MLLLPSHESTTHMLFLTPVPISEPARQGGASVPAALQRRTSHLRGRGVPVLDQILDLSHG